MSAGVELVRPHDLATLSGAEFRTLRDFVYDRSGLFFADSKKFLLESRLSRRLQAVGMTSAAEYMSLLRSIGRGGRELLELLDVVTTHETSFFRNHSQIEIFRSEVLPDLVRRAREAGGRTVQIWSAACSSGEEPYTLAMVFLEEFGHEASRGNFRVVATDVARSVLEKGQKAVYGRHSFRNTPPYYVQKYFDQTGPDTFRLKEEPRRLVEFHHLNFADNARMRAMGRFQTVFCRNALIYFDKDAQRRFVAHFAESIDPGGYLFLGHSETLHGISDAFRLVQFAGGIVYQRPPTHADRRTDACNPIA
jgi:chemotaxis protein methyltransferase CheR